LTVVERLSDHSNVPRGGKRLGSGIKKGYKYRQTLEKSAAREVVRAFVTDNMMPMLRAQLAHAMGIGHCYTRDKHGKFSRVENLEEIDRLLTEGVEGEHFFIFAKDPSAVAFKELLDRALDKPKEQAQEIHVSGEIELTARLTAARNRVLDLTTAGTKAALADSKHLGATGE
jgi:hypothetical protein